MRTVLQRIHMDILRLRKRHYAVILVGVNLMSTKTYAVLRYANGIKLHDFSTKNKADTCFKHLNVKFII